MTAKNTSTKQSKDDWSKKQFSNSEKNKLVEKLTTARVGLLLKHPFFGNMATRLTLVDASDWCTTLATDGRKFYYNNGFVDKLSAKECEFGFAHEVLHNVFDHLGRKESRDAMLSNVAADYAVNQILVDEKIGAVPKFLKIFQDNKYRDKSFEEIYDELFSKAKKINIQDLGDMFDEHLDGDDGNGNENNDQNNPKKPRLTKEERDAIREEIKEAMISSAQSVGAGKIPAGIQRMIKDFTEPKMDWRELLRMNIQSILKSNFSFSRPNRKSQHSGAILPGLLNEDTIDVSIAIDMSGSISDTQAKDFLSEIKGIMDEYQDFKIKLWCFDTAVYNYETFISDNADEILSYKVKGGGGTAFEANWKFMQENDIQPKKFIMFTDGYPGGSWGDEDYCDTLFIIHGNDSIVPPFGEHAYYDE
jgi:predicted metal-dependent peptidase